MSDLPSSFTVPSIVPVFPLPGTVFFPRTALPLHIFEPRYRAMVRDSEAGSGLIAVALLRDGEGERPEFASVGTLGRIESLQPLEDGRFELSLQGLERVAFTEVPSGKPYRLVRVEPLLEKVVDEKDPRTREAKLHLLACHAYLTRELNGDDGQSIVLNERTPFELAVNTAAAGLPVEAHLRQELLEENDLLHRQQRVGLLMEEVLETVLRLKTLKDGENASHGLN